MGSALIIHAAAAAISFAALANAQQDGTTWQYPTFFNYTIADTSAMWDYFPSPTADEASRHTWNETFSESNWTTYEPGQAGLGESGHFANGSGSPGMYLNFPMTSFQILGEVRGLNYSDSMPPLQMIIDSRTPMNCTPTPGVICSATNLIWAFHKIQVRLFSGNWTVRGIQVTTGAALRTKKMEDTKIIHEPFVFENNSLNPFFNYSGEWFVWHTLGGVGAQNASINYTTLVGQNGASVNVTVPPKTTWVVLNGTVRPDSDRYTLDWNPLPPLADSQMLFSAYNAWQAPAMLYAAPLDPETNYTLGINTYNADDTNPVNGTTLGLHSITFYNERANDTAPGWNGVPGSKKGGIIGGAVGGVLGAVVIAGLVWWLCARRKRKTNKGKKVQHPQKEVTSSNFEVDDDPYIELNDLGAAQPTPFVNQPPRANDTAAAYATAYADANATGKAAMAAASSSGHTPLLSAGDDGALVGSSADSAQQHTALLSPIGVGSHHHLPPSPAGHSPVAPSPGGTLLGGTAIGTGFGTAIGTSMSMDAGPVHPIAAELKHGDTLRRPRQWPVQVAQETDGGAVDEFELVPPVYNPAWAQERRRPGQGGSGEHLGTDVEGAPLSPSMRAPPPALSVITTPYIAVSNSTSLNSTPTTASHTPGTYTSPLSALSTHGPSLLSGTSRPASLYHPPLSATAAQPPFSFNHPPSPISTSTHQSFHQPPSPLSASTTQSLHQPPSPHHPSSPLAMTGYDYDRSATTSDTSHSHG